MDEIYSMQFDKLLSVKIYLLKKLTNWIRLFATDNFELLEECYAVKFRVVDDHWAINF